METAKLGESKIYTTSKNRGSKQVNTLLYEFDAFQHLQKHINTPATTLTLAHGW